MKNCIKCVTLFCSEVCKEKKRKKELLSGKGSVWRMDERTQSGNMRYLGSAVEPTEGSAYLWPKFFMYCIGR